MCAKTSDTETPRNSLRASVMLVAASISVACLLPANVMSACLAADGGTAPASRLSQTPYSEFKGVRLGMTADEVRGHLGKPESSDTTQDYFVFSESHRARVYYDDGGRANAIVASYLGRESGAPDAKTILGVEVEADASGAVTRSVSVPDSGFTVIYSRTGGDEPMVFVTLQKRP